MNSPNQPKISVVVAVLNGAQTLQLCVDSFTSQTFPHKELIIMDGGSTDGTAEILQRNDSAITYWETAIDRGIAHAWNKGIQRATGDWIMFLGADDRLDNPDVFAKMAPHLLGGSGVDVVYGTLLLEGGPFSGAALGSMWDQTHFNRRMTIPNPSSFARRELFAELGQFDESYKIALDYEFLLRKKNLQPLFVNVPVTIMGSHGLSMGSRQESLLEARRAQFRHKSNPAIAIHFWYWYFRVRALLH